MNKTVAIVGRPNVGKSTLFNRLIGKKKAIVDDFSGVTRDRLYDYADWNGKEFILIDTGGYVANSDDIFEREIRKQVELAVQEAEVILFMVDTTVGITDLDESFANYLRKENKTVFLIANKTDNNQRINDSYVFYKLGFENVFPVSSINGAGTGELLDELVQHLRNDGEDTLPDEPGVPKIAVVGKPNVGKSTLVNTLLGEERNIVSDIPGTTRDSIHSVYNKYGRKYIIIDTAGLRKKNRVFEDVEFYSVIRAIKSVEEADVNLLLIDAREGIQKQDLNIVHLVSRRNKGLVVLLNKWDLIEKSSNTERDYIRDIKSKMAPFTDIPIISISALEKIRLNKVLDAIFRVYENKTKLIPTSQLNKVLLKSVEDYHPPSVKGRIVRIKYVTQIKAAFPLFAFYCNYPQYIKDPYKRYLENKIRESFDFQGVPVKLSFRKK